MAHALVFRRALLLSIGALALGVAAAAQPFHALRPGEAVATCFSGNSDTGAIVGILDIRTPKGRNAPLGKPWTKEPHPNPLTRKTHWTRADLGGNEVFGIALDDAPKPNIYVTSTAIYKSTYFKDGVFQNAIGTGEVWRIDGTTGNPSLCVTLPQRIPAGGQGLGNIAFDTQYKQLFVTNFYDGRIYRLHRVQDKCQILDAYDPFPLKPTSPTPDGFAPLGERPWGVGVFQGRLYFALWSGDWSGGPANTVWSVPLDSTGKPGGAPKLEVILPPPFPPLLPVLPGGTPPDLTMPVSDIEFSTDGRMLLAQRSMNSEVDVQHDGGINDEAYSWAHQSELLEYQGASGSWERSLDPGGKNPFKLGDIAANVPRSSAGGADYICPAEENPVEGLKAEGGYVVATGDALLYPSPKVYGLQIMSPTGGDKNDSYLVDLDNETTIHDKVQIGDVDVYNTCSRQCGEFLLERVLCETNLQGKPTGRFTVEFRVKNLFKEPVFHAYLVGLPAGVTASTSYFPVAAGGDGDLDPGEVSQLLTTTISGATEGQALSFQITLHNQDLVQCCAFPVTVSLPGCKCAQVLSGPEPSCTFKPFGWTYSFTLQSLFQGTPAFVLITPDTPKTATFTPPVISFTANPKKVSLTIGNASPGQQVCFLVSLHTEDFDLCCSIRHCVTLPKWFIDERFDPQALDDSSILLTEDDLVVFNPRAAPGVTLPLLDQVGVELFWRPLAPATFGVGDFLEQTLEGRASGDHFESALATTRTVGTAAGLELRASFPGLGATHHRWELFRAGERVLTVPGVPRDVAATCNGCGPSATDAHFSVLGSLGTTAQCEGPDYPCLFSGMTFQDPGIMQVGLTGQAVAADEARVFPEDARDTVASLSELTMRASGIPSFTLTSFRGARDCNGNGIDDHAEITRGGGLDLDRDGALDECAAAPQPLAIDLATGFDQASGVALPPGANDDDWRLLAPGTERPAVVIAAPNTAWPAPLGHSRWIGAEAEAGRSGPARNYRYERRFCLAQGAHDVSLALQLLADDRALVFLNGQEVSGFGGAFRRTPLAVQRSGAAGDGLFLAGDNRLMVEVRDPSGVATGFTLAGSVTALEGACQP